MARLENGDAELAPTPPALGGDAQRSQGLTYAGAWSWYLSASRQNVLGNIVSTYSELLWDGVPVLPGVEFTLDGFAQLAGQGGAQFAILFSDDGVAFTPVAPTYGAPNVAGWRSISAAWTPTGTTLSVYVLLNYPAGFGSGFVYVDQLTLDGGEPMAVMVSEFGIRAVIAEFQASLNTEIGYVETEANIGLDLPTVSSWYAFEREVASPEATEFEAFERGEITFPDATYEQSQWQAGGRIRWTSQIPITLRLTHANRGNADAADATLLRSQMVERSRMYAAAMLRVIRNDPRCNYTDKITFLPERIRFPKDASRADVNLRHVGTVEIDGTLYLRETPDNETTLGGAALPSATQETP